MWRSVQQVVNGEYTMKSFYDRKCIHQIRVQFADFIENELSRTIADITEEVASKFYKDLREHIKLSTEGVNALSFITKPIDNLSPMELYTHLTDGIAKEIVLLVEDIQQMNDLSFIQNIITSCDEFYRTILNFYHGAGVYQAFNPLDFFANTLHNFEIRKSSVFEELQNWEKEQTFICSMHDDEKKKANQEHTHKLNKIQNCVELLFEITCKLMVSLDFLRTQYQAMHYDVGQLDWFASEIARLQQNLMEESFVVDQQPNRIIKKALKCCTTSVRWLIGRQSVLNNRISKVNCSVVSENNQDYHVELSGNVVKLEYQENTRAFSANFSLSINNIIRHKQNSDSVLDEKVALLFRMAVKCNNTTYIISKLSIPLVIVVHGNQDYQAWGTIWWDNAISDFGRIVEIQDSSKISWAKLSEALYMKCFSETKRGFTDANRNFLYEKFFSHLPVEEIPKQNFSKDFPGTNFSFWEWYYFAIKLIKDHLLEPWRFNLIEGFISRGEAIQKLQFHRPGTFLLRFSESFQGAIAISFVNQNNQIEHVQPFNSRDLQSNCLANRIRECVNVQELYPYKVDKSELYTYFGGKDVNKNQIKGYVSTLTLTFMVEDNENVNSIPDNFRQDQI